MVALLGLFLSRQIYLSNLSFWMKEPDAQATAWSVLIAALCLGAFLAMSIRRATEIGTRPKLLLTCLLILPIPFWVAALGLLPNKSERSPSPFQDFNRRLKFLVGLTAIIGVSALVAFTVLTTRRGTSVQSSGSGSSSAAISENRIPTSVDCYHNGIAYYKEIGSYPRLSTGERASSVAMDKCSRSVLAFGR